MDQRDHLVRLFTCLSAGTLLDSPPFSSLLWQLTGQTFWGRSINKPKVGGWSCKGGLTPFNACSSIWNCPTRSSLSSLVNSMLSKYWAGFKGERQTDRTTPVLQRALGATRSICWCLFEQLWKQFKNEYNSYGIPQRIPVFSVLCGNFQVWILIMVI